VVAAFPLDSPALPLLNSAPMSADAFATESELVSASKPIAALRQALNEVLFGQNELIDLTLCGVIARGHVLLEGLPGLGKTELVKGLAKALNLTTRRVQFTPDLLPGDITGNPVLQEVDGRREFVFQPGPIFTNLLLADEINRASPKTQSALLEAMQERRVTVLGQTHTLPDPFFVLATQNPIELEGTYPLPEAQVDRFLFKLEVLRNSAATLAKIVTHRELGVEPQVPAITTREEFAHIQATARRVYLPEIVADYIARIVDATHPGQSKASEGVRYGASPRAALSLASAAKARALMHGRPNASFEDVQALAQPVLNHRVLLDYTARMDGRTSASVVRAILAEVPVQNLVTPKTLKEVA
jgi:MoxR-like ATPase